MENRPQFGFIVSAIILGLVTLGITGLVRAQVSPVQNPPGSGPTTATPDVQGDTADGQGNVTGGNPFKQGCIFNTVIPTWTNGQIATEQCDNRGDLHVVLFTAGVPALYLNDNSDATAVTGTLNKVTGVSRGTVFNGTTWDRQYGSAALGTTVTPMPPAATQTGGSSGVIANAAASASIVATATRFSFISGFQITYDGATVGQCVNATLTGVLGGTRNYTVCSPTGVTLVAAPLVVNFNPPLSSTAINTQITLSVPALGAGNTNTAVNVDGYN